MSETCIRQQLRIPLELAGLRLDQAAAQLFPDHSRARLQGWISDGQLTVNQRRMRPRDRVVGGEELSLDAVLEAQGDWQAQPIEFRVLFEDDDLLVIDKPAGLVVHPAAGNWEGTLLNGLLHRIPQLIQLPRAGIVHRLDKETSGLMVVAKSLRAHTSLVGQLQNRSMGRDYEAVAEGAMIAGGTVDRPIGRHPRQRTRMAVVATGKPAVTHYRLLHRFRHYSHLRLSLETGRTHQIRV
ncbi:MAG: RluA family pseudouridine synthase, partial [Pseudomonadales bacterium]|nr:RluA family pseudouridine synthase [Pseudomonadales bacterium]